MAEVQAISGHIRAICGNGMGELDDGVAQVWK